MNFKSFSIMTFNIRFGLAPDIENPWDNRKKSVINLISQKNPDFIGIQEVNDFQLEYLKKNLPDYNVTGLYGKKDPNWQEIPIFYKKDFECVLSEHFFLSNTPYLESKFLESQWPRQAVTALFSKKNKLISITNTHFDFKDSVQIKSADLIRHKLSCLNKKIPKVLCGDFNADPTGKCYYQFVFQNPPHFKDPFSNLQSATFHGFTGIPNTGRIDWILYSGNLSPLSGKIIEYCENGKYPSDHFPVFVEFALDKS
ncbi:MAG: endonuclease/exonuclease/phosphatase family protein [Desulforegulaceae bacterium]|nr:endonuclease/exonuclease/phosphatase family protein [Desulforegulaceae bacterium]